MFIGGGISGLSKRPSVIMFVQERFLFFTSFSRIRLPFSSKFSWSG